MPHLRKWIFNTANWLINVYLVPLTYDMVWVTKSLRINLPLKVFLFFLSPPPFFLQDLFMSPKLIPNLQRSCFSLPSICAGIINTYLSDQLKLFAFNEVNDFFFGTYYIKDTSACWHLGGCILIYSIFNTILLYLICLVFCFVFFFTLNELFEL